MEFDNNIPIYIQLVDILKKDIISSKLSLGERLPSVRDLAISLKVNPNTVQRALSHLEELGLIYTERTNGKFVTTNEKLINEYKEEYANNLTKKFLDEMNDLGYSKKEIIEYLEKNKGGE